MFKFTQEHLPLINAMNESVQYILTATDDSQIAEVAKNLSDAFLTLGFTPQNHLLKALNSLNSTQEKESFALEFDNFYKATLIAISNSFKTSNDYTSGLYACDRQFSLYVDLIENNSAEDLYAFVMDKLAELAQNNPEFYQLITHSWYFEGYMLEGVDSKNNSIVTARVLFLKQNINRLKELYNCLQTNLSKDTLNAVIFSYLTFDMSEIQKICVRDADVFDTNIFPHIENEVLVDCGSYIGDTVIEYINKFGQDYKHIYTYDISAPTVEALKNNLAELKNITANVKGVGEKKDVLHLQGFATPFGGNKLTENASNVGIDVDVVTLDEDITEKISFLKIDVEGLDKEALKGAKNHIINDHPRIQVDTYHKLPDFLDVVLLINSISPTYSFYLRVGGGKQEEIDLHFAHTSICAI